MRLHLPMLAVPGVRQATQDPLNAAITFLY